MSNLTNFVRERYSENVGQDRTRQRYSDVDVLLRHFRCKTVIIALTTSSQASADRSVFHSSTMLGYTLHVVLLTTTKVLLTPSVC